MRTQLSTQEVYQPPGIIKSDRFDLVYDFTFNNLLSSDGAIPANAPLQMLHLILESPRNHAIHALDLWLFSEARKIFMTIKKVDSRQKAIRQRIIARFVEQLSPEKRRGAALQIHYMVINILEKMGFK